MSRQDLHRSWVEATMGAYRSELDAARSRIASLEAAVHHVEAERARLERSLRGPRREGQWPWRSLAVIGVAGLLVLGIVVISRPPSTPMRRAVPARLEATRSEPVSSEPPPMLARRPLFAEPSLAAPSLAEPESDSPFFGQYWEARISRSSDRELPEGTECLITMDRRPTPSGSGRATIQCAGDQLLHTSVVLTPAQEDDGYCWFSGRELYCSPPRRDTRACWVSTGGGVVHCPFHDVDLQVRTTMRNPREHAPPELG